MNKDPDIYGMTLKDLTFMTSRVPEKEKQYKVQKNF